MLLRGLRTCAERASKPHTTYLDRISKTTKELLERRTLRLDPNASHIERLVANTNCRKSLQEDLSKYKQKKILEAEQKRTSLKRFMKNAYCKDGEVELEGSQIVKTSPYVYLGRSMNMENDLKVELNRRMRAAWVAFAPIIEATDQLTDQDLRAHLFDSTVLPAFCYAAETWAAIAATSTKLLTS